MKITIYNDTGGVLEHKGCSALPDKEDDLNRKQLILDEERREKEQQTLEKERLENNIKENKIIIEELNKIKGSPDIISETTEELYEQYMKAKKYMDTTFKVQDKEYYDKNGYSNPEIKERIKKIEHYSDRITDNIQINRKDFKEVGRIIYTIMTQLHDGVIIDDVMTIRKTGIYPYRCQSRMYPESVMGCILSHKKAILDKVKNSDKNSMFKEIFLALDKLNLDFNKNYGSYDKSEESRVLYLSEPYLVSDVFNGYSSDSISFSYITGIKYFNRNGIAFVGLTEEKLKEFEDMMKEENIINDKEKEEKLNEYIRNNSSKLTFDSKTTDNYFIKFQNIIKYLSEDEIKNIKKTTQGLKTTIKYLSEKGSKYLILASFDEDLQEHLSHLN